MFDLTFLLAASAAATLFTGASAGVALRRNEEPAQPSCVNFTPYVYAGCFQDPSNPARALLYDSQLDFDTMTVEACIAFCKGMWLLYDSIYMIDPEKETITNMLVWSTMASASVAPQSTVLSYPSQAAHTHAQAINLRPVEVMTSSRFTKILHSPSSTKLS